MEVTVSSKKLDETKTREGVTSLLYGAKMKPTHDLHAEVDLNTALKGKTHTHSLAQTKFGQSLKGSFCT